MAVFASKKSSKYITNNGTVSDDAVVASDVPPRYLFFFQYFSSLSHPPSIEDNGSYSSVDEYVRACVFLLTFSGILLLYPARLPDMGLIDSSPLLF